MGPLTKASSSLIAANPKFKLVSKANFKIYVCFPELKPPIVSGSLKQRTDETKSALRRRY